MVYAGGFGFIKALLNLRFIAISIPQQAPITKMLPRWKLGV